MLVLFKSEKEIGDLFSYSNISTQFPQMTTQRENAFHSQKQKSNTNACGHAGAREITQEEAIRLIFREIPVALSTLRTSTCHYTVLCAWENNSFVCFLTDWTERA